MPDIWDKLYNAAKERLNPRQISAFVEAGGVAAALLTDKGNIYTGVCIDTACSLGMCAERAAAANMITCGENGAVKLVCVMGGGSVGYPCGACREFFMQLGCADMQILVDLEKKQTVTISELSADWWGRGRF